MINVELEVAEWLRSDPTLAGSGVVTLLPDQTVTSPWPNEIVRVVKQSFLAPDGLSWQDRQVWSSRPEVLFHCYSTSQKKAWDLWAKVCKSMLAAPFARNVRVINDGVYVADENVIETHIHRYIGSVMIMIINS